VIGFLGDIMEEGNLNGMRIVLLLLLAIVGVHAAIRGEYLLSGIFALIFTAYLIIRMPGFQQWSMTKLSEKTRRIGYFAVLTVLVLYILYALMQRLNK
jgi:hypothetical protein